MSSIDSIVSACEFFRNIDEIANQRNDKGEMNGSTVTNIHGAKSYINEQPATNPSNYESKPISLFYSIDVINTKTEQAPECTEKTVDKSLKKYQKLPLNRLSSGGDAMLSIKETIDIYERSKIDIPDDPICLQNSRKRQHPDGSNESVNKKIKQELTASTNLTTATEMATETATVTVITYAYEGSTQIHSGNNIPNTMENQLESRQPSAEEATANAMLLAKEKTDIATLLKMSKCIHSIEWEEMFLRIIHHHIIMSQLQRKQKLLQQGPKLLDIMEIYINECIEKDPDFENKQLSLQCDKNTADVDKYTLLLYLLIKKKRFHAYIGERTKISHKTLSTIIIGLKQCTPNIYTLLVSYTIYTERNALVCQFNGQPNDFSANEHLFRCLQKATVTTKKMQVWDILKKYVDKDIEKLYEAALKYKQDLELKRY